ncbi:MAG TPA: thioredoxin family protein [Chitinophagaceae bacterium]|nr:thioredoxin family protein [Chitinophagaceae bacterium]
MRNFFVIAFSFIIMSFNVWQQDFETAKQVAKEKHELILLNFSGSDWCGPCMRMKKEIFENDKFLKMADNSLVLLNADFPRNKKNQLHKNVQKQNDALADKYNAEGKFPFTLLLDEDGKILKTWEGLPNQTADEFAEQIKNICDAHK